MEFKHNKKPKYVNTREIEQYWIETYFLVFKQLHEIRIRDVTRQQPYVFWINVLNVNKLAYTLIIFSRVLVSKYNSSEQLIFLM